MRYWLSLLALAGCHARSEGPSCEDGGCVEVCDNGVDDDQDGYADCDDPQCDGSCAEICGNGRDDDGDGRADCDDAECSWICSEICNNGVDDDGDWIVDCADVDQCGSTCDADGDGYVKIDPADGYDGDDCDDTNAEVHPGAAEIYYNGLDDDCDALTIDDDQDSDTYPVDVDCDDLNPATHPGATEEICGDGEVNDCDAAVAPDRSTCYGERSLGTADYQFFGTKTAGQAGNSVAGAADTNGDGEVDLVIGAYETGAQQSGAAYVVHGPFARRTDLVPPAACEIDGNDPTTGDWLGVEVAAVGDLDGDGLPNLAAGARYETAEGIVKSGRIAVILEPCIDGPVSDTTWSVIGEKSDELGKSYAAAGDATGDGFDDLIIGIPTRDQYNRGGALLLAGPLTGPITYDAEPEVTLMGRQGDAYTGGENAGLAVSGPGDLDGDGLADLVIGAPDYDGALGADTGRVYVVYSPVAGVLPLDGEVAIDVAGPGALLGWSFGVVGDITGDGTTDLAVGAPAAQVGSGSVLVFDHVGSAPYAVLSGAAINDQFGWSITGLGDANGDGQPEIAVGAQGDSTAAPNAGAAYVWFGPLSLGAYGDAEADVRLLGEAENDYAGYSVASPGDVDHDGFADLLVGAPFHDSYLSSDGIAYLVTFGL